MCILISCVIPVTSTRFPCKSGMMGVVEDASVATDAGLRLRLAVLDVINFIDSEISPSFGYNIASRTFVAPSY